MLRLLTVVLLLCTLTGCDGADSDGSADRVEPPELGACRVLTPEDIVRSTNSSQPVDCSQPHTAETFAVGTFPVAAAGERLDDERLGAAAYRICDRRFQRFVGADDSLAMRSLLTWAYFRPSEEAWRKGARWYRCDVVAGNEASDELLALPETARGILLGRPDDRWMVCVNADTVAGAPRIPCSEPHSWRAVTTVVLGKPADPYPGDRPVESRTRAFCRDSVGAWLNYPVDYDYAYTWFHEAEWEAGNRRSVCWARTDQ